MLTAGGGQRRPDEEQVWKIWRPRSVTLQMAQVVWILGKIQGGWQFAKMKEHDWVLLSN